MEIFRRGGSDLETVRLWDCVAVRLWEVIGVGVAEYETWDCQD
jgi:hypothetical protein